ncbi:hypothetical protein MCO_01557 [Bartonella sp. DB5-6]|uniref:hypothetical protein n=1 Tax=Bartonella sp. DB5-6 TaxID=1094755 RepID=UPI00026E9484|nr:hypothetical protein [Bartonella sp. DB5-6]EJF76718.1 hypothetical protein MCO_01557 [Bartonella sp. DB5-6]
MIQQEKFLIVAFAPVLTNADALYEEPQNNQIINGDHNHNSHTLHTHQKAFEYGFIKNKAPKNTRICDNAKQWQKIHLKDFPTAFSKRTKSTFKKEMYMTLISKEHFTFLTSKELKKHHEAVEITINTHTFEGM